MPGRGTHIPAKCTDAAGRTRRLFNPAVKKYQPPQGFSAAEWSRILRQISGTSVPFWRSLAALLAVGTAFSVILGAVFAKSGMKWWYGLAGLWPPLGACLGYWFLKSIAEHTWGVIAFTDVPDEKVAAVLIAHDRCPSCSYPLGVAAGPGENRTCSECGAEWPPMPAPA